MAIKGGAPSDAPFSNHLTESHRLVAMLLNIGLMAGQGACVLLVHWT